MEIYLEIPTVKEAQDFDPEKEAQILRDAMKGIGCKKDPIIDVLTRVTLFQRFLIKTRYQQMFGRELVKDMKSELGGNLQVVAVALMTPLPEYLADELHSAMKGPGTDEATLVEIICTRSNQEILEITEQYNLKHKQNLLERVKDETSGYFRRLLVSLLAGDRNEHFCDVLKAPEVANELYRAGELKLGTDETVFNRIMCTYSRPFLINVFHEYNKICGHSFEEALKKELSGELLEGHLAIYRSVQNRPSFFAHKLHKAMKGFGTNDRALIRILVSRCEIDLENIKEEFKIIAKSQLSHKIRNETSGDYKKILLRLLNECI